MQAVLLVMLGILESLLRWLTGMTREATGCGGQVMHEAVCS